ncbi:MAG: acetyl-CoA carboxylase carboxyltransferase subunit beta [Acidobacteria bacterium]|nr:acetyl-CoA carboxylase carboxyltransferase subunit beta [Acidobacteriota bacterium]
MAWFKKEKTPKQPVEEKRVRIPGGLWVKCDNCREIIYKKEVLRNANVCPKCNYHFRISSRERLQILFDNGLYEEFDRDISPTDPLSWKDSKPYKDRLKAYQESTGLKDAIVNAVGLIGGIPSVISAMEYGFMGGSMGSVVGEKIARAGERALADRRPLIVVSASGGARMQEGILSLMQMAKISSVLAKLDDEGIPFISILTDPTTGGVTASFAMLGDLNIAEPKALIGFAGPRVIEQTIRETLPEGFQRSEFQLEKGMIDMVVDRANLKATLERCLRFMVAGAGVDGARSA